MLVYEGFSFTFILTVFLFVVCVFQIMARNPAEENKTKFKRKRRGEKLSSWKFQYDTLSHLINSFIIRFFHAGVSCKELLVWFKDPGLCYTVRLAGPQWDSSCILC